MSPISDVHAFLRDVVTGRRALTIALLDEQGRRLGEMRPITQADLDNAAVVQALTDWRNANMRFFFGQFVATAERTRAWMQNVLLATPGQMLFMIHVGGQMVGHYGFKQLQTDDVLLDNAMLGERCSQPGVMREAGRALINWLFAHTPVQRVWGEVLTTNAPALMLNREIGFRVERKLPMYQRDVNGEASWVMGDEHSTEKAAVYCYKLAMDRSDHARLPWAIPTVHELEIT